jgi:hypothetical protein
MTKIVHNNGALMTPKTADVALKEFSDADHVAIPPVQLRILIDAIFPPNSPVVSEIKDSVLITAYPVERFGGLRLLIDDKMPKDEIHFRDKDGVPVGKITNLAT